MPAVPCDDRHTPTVCHDKSLTLFDISVVKISSGEDVFPVLGGGSAGSHPFFTWGGGGLPPVFRLAGGLHLMPKQAGGQAKAPKPGSITNRISVVNSILCAGYRNTFWCPTGGCRFFRLMVGRQGHAHFLSGGEGGSQPLSRSDPPRPPPGTKPYPHLQAPKPPPPHAKYGCVEEKTGRDTREPDQDSVHRLIVPTESMKSEDIVVPRGGSGPGSSAISRSSTHGMDDEVSGITILRELSTLAFRSGSVTISPFKRE